MSQSFESVEVFCSYAHKDEAWRRKLDTHLNLLQQQGLISVWHDRQIVAGTDWTQTIDEHLDSASLILLLISPDFLASEYCMGIEVERALQHQRANEARVIPILLRRAEGWESAPFAYLQALPTGAQFVTDWEDGEAALADVTAGIRRSLEDLSLLAASLPRANLPSIWNIPFARNPFFTGREDLLERLHTQLQTTQTAALSQPQAISGLGGIGKTQLAIEYAYRNLQTYKAILWVRADTPETLNASYSEIAALLNLPEKEAQKQEILVQAVKNWLQHHRNYLLILDNADEPDHLTAFLPSFVTGHILITTRAADLSHLNLGLAASLILPTFTPVQGSSFLFVRMEHSQEPTPAEETLAQILSHKLGGLPLALDQAGAYIKTAAITLEDYLHLFRQNASVLLKNPQRQNYPMSVAKTWNISFARIAATSPAAADLLYFCAFLAPDAIPEELLSHGQPHFPQRLAHLVANPLHLNDAIVALRSYSLIYRDPLQRTLTVHRLVQRVIRESLPVSPRRTPSGRKHRTWTQEEWKQCVVQVLAASFPDVEFPNWPSCERLLPHAQVCALWIEEKKIAMPDAAFLLRETGIYLHERGRYMEAEGLYKRALRIREEQLGGNHPKTATSLNDLAALYEEQGEYTEAEGLCERARRIREEQLGEHHLKTASSLDNLAVLYAKQGKYAEAEGLYDRALRIYEEQLGGDHPETARSLDNLAVLYAKQGKYAEAERSEERALRIKEEQLGEDHPSTATGLNNLAVMYEAQGKHIEAEKLLKRAQALYERALGDEHPFTQSSREGYVYVQRLRVESEKEGE